MSSYRIKIRITTHTETNLSEESLVSSVGAIYEHTLNELKIPYDFIEVEVDALQETPKLEIVKSNGHKKHTD